MRTYFWLILSLLSAGTFLLVVRAPGAPASSIIIALDTMPAGNSATSVGSVQSCVSVDPGDTFDVDVVVTEVQDLAGFQVRLNFDPEVVQIEGRQANFLLGEGGLEAGDIDFPVTNGSWYYGYTNLPARNGSGVLVRITLKALASGSTRLSLPVGPLDTALVDSSFSYIAIEGVIEGTIRVGSECTPEEITPTVVPVTPQPSPTTSSTPTPGPGGQLQGCPLANRWSIAVWSGPDNVLIGDALATCTGVAIDAAYWLDPDSQSWWRYFPSRPDISSLGALDDMQAVIALGSASGAASAAHLASAEGSAFQLHNCPQPGKWAISAWDGPNDTAIDEAVATCPDTSVAAAYWLDPQTQGWLRYFYGRPDISNLATINDVQGVITLGRPAGNGPAGTD
jgi:hypothetical protein